MRHSRDARGDKEVVREPVQERACRRVERRVERRVRRRPAVLRRRVQRDDATLRASADRARHVQRRGSDACTARARLSSPPRPAAGPFSPAPPRRQPPCCARARGRGRGGPPEGRMKFLSGGSVASSASIHASSSVTHAVSTAVR